MSDMHENEAERIIAEAAQGEYVPLPETFAEWCKLCDDDRRRVLVSRYAVDGDKTLICTMRDEVLLECLRDPCPDGETEGTKRLTRRLNADICAEAKARGLLNL